MQNYSFILKKDNRRFSIFFAKFFGVGFLYISLATGAIFPIDLGNNIFFLHTIIISIIFAFLLMNKDILGVASKSLFILSPFVITIFVSFLSSDIPELAAGKIEGAVFATILSTCLAAYMLNHGSERSFLKYFLAFSFFILTITMIYRILLGLESRDDRFFINGPIVFGWIMGLNALISFFLFQNEKSRLYLIPASIFIAATLLTGSKGPAVAVAIAMAILSLRWVNRASTWVFIIFGAFSIFASASFISQDNLDRFLALERFVSGESSELDYGSVGTRYDAWADSIDMFLSHPVFGVGLGNWNLYAYNKIDYPHNFIMELISETGVLGLISFSIPLIYIVSRSGLLGRIIVMYFMICMSFSGDMSYYRFMIAIPLAMVLVADRQKMWRHKTP